MTLTAPVFLLTVARSSVMAGIVVLAVAVKTPAVIHPKVGFGLPSIRTVALSVITTSTGKALPTKQSGVPDTGPVKVVLVVPAGTREGT